MYVRHGQMRLIPTLPWSYRIQVRPINEVPRVTRKREAERVEFRACEDEPERVKDSRVVFFRIHLTPFDQSAQPRTCVRGDQDVAARSSGNVFRGGGRCRVARLHGAGIRCSTAPPAGSALAASAPPAASVSAAATAASAAAAAAAPAAVGTGLTTQYGVVMWPSLPGLQHAAVGVAPPASTPPQQQPLPHHMGHGRGGMLGAGLPGAAAGSPPPMPGDWGAPVSPPANKARRAKPRSSAKKTQQPNTEVRNSCLF